MIRRPYTVTNGVAVFDDPPPEDITPNEWDGNRDPYSELFVSVPLDPRPQ